MSLANLIKKGSLRGFATATDATFATHQPITSPSVAAVAKVAVAKAPDIKINELVLNPDRWCWPKSIAMNTREIEAFSARLARFVDMSIIRRDADHLADLLVFRDREEDDRAMCLECIHLSRVWRCENWQRAGVSLSARDAVISVELVSQLQRCDGFLKYEE